MKIEEAFKLSDKVRSNNWEPWQYIQKDEETSIGLSSRSGEYHMSLEELEEMEETFWEPWVDPNAGVNKMFPGNGVNGICLGEPIQIVETTPEKLECSCESAALFNFGCKCGGV